MRKFLCKLLKATPSEDVYNTIEEMTTADIIKYMHNRHVVQKTNLILVSEDEGGTRMAMHCSGMFKTITAMHLMGDGE